MRAASVAQKLWRAGELSAADQRALYGTRPARLPDLLGDWQRAVVRAAAEELGEPGLLAYARRAYDDALRRWRPKLADKKDLAPLIYAAPGARWNEVVLWESPRALVVADLFAPGPKALIFPKPPVELPIDLSARELAHIAEIAAKAAAAFVDADHRSTPEVWVNPPQRLMVRQLHVHVAPHLPTWEERGLSRRPPAVVLRRQYARLIAQLARHLGPSL